MENFDLNTQNSQIFYFDWFVFCKEWCKIWRKTDLWFGKWHEKIGKFLAEYSKVSKLGLWCDPFIQNKKYMSLKLAVELCVMTKKNDTKSEEELTCRFKIDMSSLTNVEPSTQSLKNLHFNGILLNKVCNVWVKKVQRSYVS